jgi:hypothetical protein
VKYCDKELTIISVSVRWIKKMGPFTPDLRFSGQTKQGSRHLLLLLVGSITEGKSCKSHPVITVFEA